MSFEYLASPYSSRDETLRKERYKRNVALAAKLMSEGRIIFSPLVHSCNLEASVPENLRYDHDFWMNQDIPLLRHASKLLVYKLPGWDGSWGVAEEIRVAQECRIPVEYIENV